MTLPPLPAKYSVSRFKVDFRGSQVGHRNKVGDVMLSASLDTDLVLQLRLGRDGTGWNHRPGDMPVIRPAVREPGTCLARRHRAGELDTRPFTNVQRLANQLAQIRSVSDPGNVSCRSYRKRPISKLKC